MIKTIGFLLFSNIFSHVNQWMADAYELYPHNKLIMDQVFKNVIGDNKEAFFMVVASHWVFFLEKNDGNPQKFIGLLMDLHEIMAHYNKEDGWRFMEILGLHLIMASYRVDHWSPSKFNYILKQMINAYKKNQLPHGSLLIFLYAMVQGLKTMDFYWHSDKDKEKKQSLLQILFNNKNHSLDYYGRYFIFPWLWFQWGYSLIEFLQEHPCYSNGFPWSLMDYLASPYNDYYQQVYGSLGHSIFCLYTKGPVNQLLGGH
jgi:hypothetical protein